MIIQTLGKKYVVIKCNSSDSQIDRFLCREDTSDEQYTIVRIKDRKWIEETMEFLVKAAENSAFTDFKSCFSSEEYFHVVFSFGEGDTLQEKMKNEASSLKERFAIGRNLLEQLMVLKMPDYFMQDCLTPETIVVLPDLEILFQYELKNIHQYRDYGFDSVCSQLYQVFEFLFHRELSNRQIPLLKSFLNQLQSGTWKELMAIYREYAEICEKIQNMTPEELAKPKTWVFRTWDKVKQHFGQIKKIISVVFLLLAVVYLLYTIRHSMQPSAINKSFDYIGTLQLRE